MTGLWRILVTFQVQTAAVSVWVLRASAVSAVGLSPGSESFRTAQTLKEGYWLRHCFVPPVYPSNTQVSTETLKISGSLLLFFVFLN